MKLQTFLIVGMIIELCFVPRLDAKRSFGITRSRNKGNKPSVRRNHGHDFDESPVPAVHPKPSAPELRKPSLQSSHAPAGPPPAYPGMGHHAAAPYGAPPAYSPSYASPPGYSSGMGYNNQPRFNQPMPGAFGQPTAFGHPGGYNSFGGSAGVMPMGVMPMAAMPMGGGNGRSSGFGSGMMTNLFAGLAGYQLARAFSGGSHHQNRDREVIVIDNRQPAAPLNPNPVESTNPVNQPIPETHLIFDPTPTESPPVTQFGPANNEYNYWESPQYGIPLYGYNLPSQITDYYQTAVVSRPQSTPQEPAQQPTSGQ